MIDPFLGEFAFESLLRLQGAVDPEDRGPGQQHAQNKGDDLQGCLLCWLVAVVSLARFVVEQGADGV